LTGRLGARILWPRRRLTGADFAGLTGPESLAQAEMVAASGAGGERHDLACTRGRHLTDANRMIAHVGQVASSAGIEIA
jgi:hypothetical protein